MVNEQSPIAHLYIVCEKVFSVILKLKKRIQLQATANRTSEKQSYFMANMCAIWMAVRFV